MEETGWTPEVMQRLLAPLPAESVDFLPRGGEKKDRGTPRRCAAMAYCDAATVIARLNDVCGSDWSFETEIVHLNSAVVMRGKLTLCGVTREDYGEARGESEPYKSAWSDALKRTARSFGVGLYLWFLGETWGEHDGWKWTQRPVLSQEALESALRQAGYTGAVPRQSAHPARQDARETPAGNGAAIDAHNERQRQEEAAIHRSQWKAPAPAESSGDRAANVDPARATAELQAEWDAQGGDTDEDTLNAYVFRVLARKPRPGKTDPAGYVADLQGVLETLKLSRPEVPQ